MYDESLLIPFRAALLPWFAAKRRPLPWREDYTPYRTWIAEIMMQQTQMERGVEYFLRWMERFPDIAAVAAAEEEELLKAWEGLGYYRRARNIQAAARKIMEEHAGIFPSSYSAILALPGIGPYTAGAIASTAFNEDVPCVDGNVERVLARFFNIASPVREEPAKSHILGLAGALIPSGQARDFNQGLMELGALVCRKIPLCADCPLAGLCESRRLGIAETRPVPGRKSTITRLDMATGVLIRAGHVFVQQRRKEDVWGGLWEFPGGCLEAGERPEQALVREWQEELGFRVRVREPLAVLRHAYTTYRITLHCFLVELDPKQADAEAEAEGESALARKKFPVPPVLTEATAFRWLPIGAISDIPLPAPHRKLVELCPVFGASLTKKKPRSRGGQKQWPLLA